MRPRTAVILLLIVHAMLFSYCSVRKSICMDEGAHLAAGAAYLRFGEMSIYDLSPPLMRLWDALPEMIARCNVPIAKFLRDESPGTRHWTYFENFQAANEAWLQRYAVMGRFMQLPISLGLALAIYLTARRLYGDWAAVLACGVYCLDPTVIAHASTVGTDLGITATLFGAVIAWMRFTESRSWRWLLMTALLVGAAHAIKFNALLIWPVLIAMIYLAPRRRESWIGLCVVAVVCYVMVNLSYGFQLWGRPVEWFEFRSQLMQGIQRHLPAKLPVPFPQFLVEGFDAQKWEADGAYVSVLFGKALFGGDWRYYPWMLLCKTPLTSLLLLICCIGSFVYRRPDRREAPLLMLAAIILIGMIGLASINVGLRYVLPVYPPMIVLVARIARPKLAWLILPLFVEVALAAPWFHSYTNLVARRANLPDQDYGQSLIELRNWMKRNQVDEITLLSIGWVDPKIYGIKARPLDQPRTSYFAVSKNFLEGIPWRSRSEFYLLRGWRELSQTKPLADLDGIVVFPADATGPEPWVRAVKSWDEAAADPAMIRIENLDERRNMTR